MVLAMCDSNFFLLVLKVTSLEEYGNPWGAESAQRSQDTLGMENAKVS